MLSNATTTVPESQDQRKPYRLGHVRWGSTVFLRYPQGSAEWYVARAHRLAGFANHLGTIRARNRAHYAILSIASFLRDEDRGANADLLAIAVKVRTRWWAFGSRYEDAA